MHMETHTYDAFLALIINKNSFHFVNTGKTKQIFSYR